ncbi:MAG: hypothetical protein Q4C95_03705 [Planctomycetia bacterium]|nr:hypothetical protein [Planctomycetia bacterium]
MSPKKRPPMTVEEKKLLKIQQNKIAARQVRNTLIILALLAGLWFLYLIYANRHQRINQNNQNNQSIQQTEQSESVTEQSSSEN